MPSDRIIVLLSLSPEQAEYLWEQALDEAEFHANYETGEAPTWTQLSATLNVQRTLGIHRSRLSDVLYFLEQFASTLSGDDQPPEALTTSIEFLRAMGVETLKG